MLRYREIPPPPDLAAAIDRLWTMRGAAAGEPQRVLPDGAVELVLDLGDPFGRVLPGGAVATQPRRLLVGPTTRPVTLTASGRVDLVGVRFRPGGAAALVPSPLDELRDAMVELGAAAGPGARALTERLAEDDDAPRRLGLVTAFLRRSLRLERLDPLAMAAVRDLLAAGGARRVSEVGGRLGVSARTLERRFRRQVGMGPKLFARLARFQEVLRQGRGRTDLPGLALDAGYYDQPHLLRDFREFVGLAPREYFRPEANEMSRLFIAGDDGP